MICQQSTTDTICDVLAILLYVCAWKRLKMPIILSFVIMHWIRLLTFSVDAWQMKLSNSILKKMSFLLSLASHYMITIIRHLEDHVNTSLVSGFLNAFLRTFECFLPYKFYILPSCIQ